MAAGVLAFESIGILASRVRHLPLRGSNPTNEAWNSQLDNKPIHLNRRDYDRTTGSVIGIQVGPNQTATTTHDVTGAEIRARSTVGTGALIAVNAQPAAKSSTATVGAVRAFEANVECKGTRTVTNDVSALRAFLDVDSTVTVTGKKSLIQIATPNVSGWDNLIHSETNAGLHVVGAGTYSTADGYFKVRVAGSDYRLPFFAGTD